MIVIYEVLQNKHSNEKMKISQITIIGGVDAYFNAFVDMIPKPVLFPKNNTAKILADAIRDLAPSKDDFE